MFLLNSVLVNVKIFLLSCFISTMHTCWDIIFLAAVELIRIVALETLLFSLLFFINYSVYYLIKTIRTFVCMKVLPVR